MSVLLLPTSQNCILRGNMHSKARQFHTVKVPPGVIGEGRAITKAVTPTASYPDQRVVGNSCNVSPRLERAMQVVSSQNGPYETVPPMSSSFNRPPLPIHQIFQQNPPDRYTDDMICNLKSRSFSKSRHFSSPDGSLSGSFPTRTHSPITPALSEPAITDFKSDDDDDDDEDDEYIGPIRSKTHPNKYPVQIESHDSKLCTYRRQQSRSGPKIRQISPLEQQQIKYYQKDLVRICHCNDAKSRNEYLAKGMDDDCDGYEIHYSQKCKWKAYDDFKTGKRVLIRLCKCYSFKA